MADSFLPSLSKRMLAFSRELVRFFPGMNVDLFQAEIESTPDDYLATGLMYSVIAFFITFVAATSMLYLYRALEVRSFIGSLGIAIGFGAVEFWYFTAFPKLKVSGKVREVERVLLFAMRHLLIKIKSGMPLYNSMVGIAQGPYGVITNEFKRAVKEINSGVPEEEAIEKMALRNPSFFFRRTIWQVANSLRAGSDFSPVLEDIVSTLAWEQRTRVRQFGSELSTMALMYLMTTIIFPALSIVFLIVLGSFAGIKVPQITFFIISGSIILFQLFFINFIRMRRPVFEEQ